MNNKPIIAYPLTYSEFEVQAELYNELKHLKYNVRGEVRSKVFDNGKKHNTRFDLVIFNALKLPIIIIECKSYKSKNYTINRKTRQFRRYSKFQLPLLYCYSIKQIPKIINEVEDTCQNLMFS